MTKLSKDARREKLAKLMKQAGYWNKLDQIDDFFKKK